MRLILSVLFFLCLITAPALYAQQPDSSATEITPRIRYRIDSALIAQKKYTTDSLMQHTWILPDSLIKTNMLLDSVEKEYLFPVLDLQAWYQKYQHLKKKENPYKQGMRIAKGKPWNLFFVLGLILVFAVLKVSFQRQINAVFQALYSNRSLNNISKEDNLFTSWPFLLLYILFGGVFGMFLYLMAQYQQHYLVQSQGFQFYLKLSMYIILLYALKMLFLRFIGFVFNVQKPVRDYVSILYLSYFNAALLFMPLVLAFALTPTKYGEVYAVVALSVLLLVFVIQLVRAGLSILNGYKFSKLHLILYFCALEICPLLILFKSIGL